MENFKSARVIVTGGAGFIGSNLVKRLVKEGAEVHVLDNLSRGSLSNLRGTNDLSPIDLEHQFYLTDLADYGKCLEVIRDADLVYHLADVVGGVHFALHQEAFIFRQNVLINSNVLTACVTNRIPNFVYVGTACSYPKHLQTSKGIAALTEDQTYPAEPESSYGWSKLMGEYEAELAQDTGKIDVGILRLHNVYGPGVSFDPRTSQVLPSLIRKAILYPEEPFVVWGSGHQYRDFIYIDDVVEALLLVAQHGTNKGAIQIGSEKPTTIKEAAELIVRVSGKAIEIRYDASKPEGDRGRIAVCDRARDILGWGQGVMFTDGLERTYGWISNQIKS